MKYKILIGLTITLFIINIRLLVMLHGGLMKNLLIYEYFEENNGLYEKMNDHSKYLSENEKIDKITAGEIYIIDNNFDPMKIRTSGNFAFSVLTSDQEIWKRGKGYTVQHVPRFFNAQSTCFIVHSQPFTDMNNGEENCTIAHVSVQTEIVA